MVGEGDLFGILWLVIIGVAIVATVIIIKRDKAREKNVIQMLDASLKKGDISPEEYKELYLKFKDETCDACPNWRAYLSEIRRKAYKEK